MTILRPSSGAGGCFSGEGRDTLKRWPVPNGGVNVWRWAARGDTFASMEPTAHGVIRAFLGIATWGSLALALLTKDLRWFVASGAFGTTWWTLDMLIKWLLAPLGDFFARFFRGDLDLPPANIRPTADETVRFLEHHIEQNAGREVQIQAALRLADIYRALYRDGDRARAMLELVKSRFPDAEETSSER